MTDCWYATESEFFFIQHLGNHCDGYAIPRINLLEKYIEAASKRIRWGAIDQRRSILFAQEQYKSIAGAYYYGFGGVDENNMADDTGCGDGVRGKETPTMGQTDVHSPQAESGVVELETEEAVGETYRG